MLDDLPSPLDILSLNAEDLGGKPVEINRLEHEELSALVFKTLTDPTLVSLAFVRAFPGSSQAALRDSMQQKREKKASVRS
ncbi:MAG: hypothetical protein VKO39_13785 [Cyanobacteriota bacterium]|nr:hypothetical protein [Cyanobacteriota bacterium]